MYPLGRLHTLPSESMRRSTFRRPVLREDRNLHPIEPRNVAAFILRPMRKVTHSGTSIGRLACRSTEGQLSQSTVRLRPAIFRYAIVLPFLISTLAAYSPSILQAQHPAAD